MGSHFGNKFAAGPHKQHVDKVYTDDFIEKEAKLLVEWMKKSPHNIYFRSFARERGYSSQRMYEWKEVNTVFAEAFEIAKDWQQSKLVDSGLFERTNPGFTKFILSAVHGMKEADKPKEEAPSEYEQLLQDIKPNE